LCSGRIDIAVIRRQLGHASLLTTVRYLDHLEPESVVTRIGMRQPTT
jgi:integrase